MARRPPAHLSRPFSVPLAANFHRFHVAAVIWPVCSGGVGSVWSCKTIHWTVLGEKGETGDNRKAGSQRGFQDSPGREGVEPKRSWFSWPPRKGLQVAVLPSAENSSFVHGEKVPGKARVGFAHWNFPCRRGNCTILKVLPRDRKQLGFAIRGTMPVPCRGLRSA